MSKLLKPEELERMKKELDTTSEGAARGAARKKLDAMFPFEPSPGDGQPEVHINLPNESRARLRPNKTDPVDIDIDARGKGGQPVDMTRVTGKPSNPDGSVTVDPREVVDTLGKVGEVDLSKGSSIASSGTMFATRPNIAGSGGRTTLLG